MFTFIADSSTNAQNVNVNANIRPAEDILRYVEREWKGSTPKAVTIRKVQSLTWTHHILLRNGR